MSKRSILATAALPYANGDIHIGHLVEYLQTDFWARFQRMRGNDCLYVCADDTHGTPVMIKARQEGIAPEELIAASRQRHLRDFTDFEILFDNYHTTHSPENRRLCNLIFQRINDSGNISRRLVPQLFCRHDRMFLPDRFVRGQCPRCGASGQYGDGCEKCDANYAVEDLLHPVCAICGAGPELRESEHLFFEINACKPFLDQWLRKHTQPDVANKLLEWFSEDLRPWNISRDAPYFGFEIPGHKDKFFYVWMDAPIGYMASLKNWCEKHGRDFNRTWNDAGMEICHFIGKDIARFHCLFWPAMLRCAGFKTPDQVFVHGFLTINGEKMSKSKGTFISARQYLEHLDPQHLRFYYACKINGSTEDMDLNVQDFNMRINSDLVGKITNLASRGVQMLHKSLGGRLGKLDSAGGEMVEQARNLGHHIANCYEARDFSRALVEIRTAAEEANRFFDAGAPWQLVKTDPESARAILTATLNVFRLLAIYLAPVLPSYACRVAELFGEGDGYRWQDHERVMEERELAPYTYLARRVEKGAFEKVIAASRSVE